MEHGETHIVTVLAWTPDGDFSYDVKHPGCSVKWICMYPQLHDIYEIAAMLEDREVPEHFLCCCWNHSCDFQTEIENEGLGDALGEDFWRITDPGQYPMRAWCTAWTDYEGGTEWDGGIELVNEIA